MERVNLLRSLPKPAAYMEEVHLIDFEKVDGGLNPIFIGAVRDPYSRFKSKWEYSRNTM